MLPKRNQEIHQSIENDNKSKSNSQNLNKDEPFASDDFDNIDELMCALENDISLEDNQIKESSENKKKENLFDEDGELSAYIERIVDNELDTTIYNSNQDEINSNFNQAIPKRENSNHQNNSKDSKLESKTNSSKDEKKRLVTEELNRKTKMLKLSPSKNINTPTIKEKKILKCETITCEISQKIPINDTDTFSNTQSNNSQSLNKSQIEEEIGVTSLSEIIRAHREEEEEDIFVIRVKSKKCLKKLSSLNNKWSMTILLTDGTDQLPFIFTNNVFIYII